MQLYYSILVFILGTIFGSFLNVIIYRLPKNESIVYGSSHCPNCQKRIKAYDLIPIISFFILKGKCRSCDHPISIRYPLVELMTGIGFYLVFNLYQFTLTTIIGIILTMILICVAMIDIDTMEIYDRFHLVIFFLAFVNLFLTSLPLLDHLIGMVVISIPFYIIAYLTGGIGGGDIKLMFVTGLLLGYKATLVAFFIAVIIGGTVAIYLLISKQKERGSKLAFGPFLCIGIYFAFLYGNTIMNWYLSLL
ncbi:MAG: prepilin peptidase [Erysipelotrichaceae bacterium]|nr:prepilin peptidase [Erysipelotrichaceae bacterium]